MHHIHAKVNNNYELGSLPLLFIPNHYDIFNLSKLH